MRVAITGATGLVGSNLARLLAADGAEVVCTRRATSRVDHLDDVQVTWAEADLGDPGALARAFADCDVIYHCAAAVSVRKPPPPVVVATNVGGTHHVISAMRAAGARRLLHCSSAVTCAISRTGAPVTEDEPWNFDEFGLDDGYAVTKRESEQIVLAAAADGLDAVVVNPTYMLGPCDPKPSSGRMIIDVARGRVPGYPTGMNNFVDVRDVCRGMIAAAAQSEPGERYILGGENLSYREIMTRIAREVGRRPPRLRIPRALARVAGWGGDLKQRITGRDADINSSTVAYGYCAGYIFSSEKARRALGYDPGPIEPAIRDALAWFRERDMM